MSLPRSILTMAALAALAGVAWRVTGVEAGPTSQQTVTVEMAAGPVRFVPPEISVAPGTTVTWVTTSGSHTSTSETGLWDTGRRLAVGESFSYTFTTPGTYGYYCEPHRDMGMVGVVRVTTAVKAMGRMTVAPMP